MNCWDKRIDNKRLHLTAGTEPPREVFLVYLWIVYPKFDFIKSPAVGDPQRSVLKVKDGQ